MKEFRADTGGRYTYNEDVLNLQDLALAFNEIFTECDNFIVSGCVVTGHTISPGYVYINKKLRYFPGAQNVNQWPQYLYEYNHIENTTYVNGDSKIARIVFGCRISNQQPSDPDDITNMLPGVLAVTQNGGKTINDAFFGKYALLQNPANSSQTVHKPVNFTDNVDVGGMVTTVGGVKITNGVSNGRVYYSGNDLIVSSSGEGNGYLFKISNGTGFQFYSNGTLCMEINHSGVINFRVPVNGQKATLGGLTITASQFYQSATAGEATLNINMLSHNGGVGYYRNTAIGDGQGNTILEIIGNTKSIYAKGLLHIDSGNATGILLKATASRSSLGMQSYIGWQDRADTPTAQIGFTSSNDNVFRVSNSVAAIDIFSASTVNIGPAIQENGVLLSDKYILKTVFNQSMAQKVGIDNVYTRLEADNKFADKNTGFSQFINENTTDADLRADIGAIGANDLTSYAALDSCLEDMAVDDDAKARIRNNIGACPAGNYQPALKDTGWQKVNGTYAVSLYARQIGDIVCIQGKIRTGHNQGDRGGGVVFELPESIDPPAYAVGYSVSVKTNSFPTAVGTWACEIPANSRSCENTYCESGHGYEVNISLTYMANKPSK